MSDRHFNRAPQGFSLEAGMLATIGRSFADFEHSCRSRFPLNRREERGSATAKKQGPNLRLSAPRWQFSLGKRKIRESHRRGVCRWCHANQFDPRREVVGPCSGHGHEQSRTTR